MTGAEFKTLRETLGLPVSWMASQARVRERSVNYWESGRFAVPDDAVALLWAVKARLNAKFQELKGSVETGSQCLVRYRTDEEMLAFEPDMEALPLSSYSAVLGWLQQLPRLEGEPIGIVWMESDDYREWLAHKPECQASRLAWATHVYSRKAKQGHKIEDILSGD